MLTDGTLMRLAQGRLPHAAERADAANGSTGRRRKRIVASGGKWLDVRLPSEFENYHMEGAINLPLYFIRLKLKSLDRDVHYVVCCDTGRRSSAAPTFCRSAASTRRC